MAKKKIKQFKSFTDTAYINYIGYKDVFDCEVCCEELYYPQKKCPECKTTYKYSHAVLRLIRPDVVKRIEIQRTMHPWYKPEPIPVVHKWSLSKWWSSSRGWRRFL
jgi:hypothetical protein